jgi:hypothetical protein
MCQRRWTHLMAQIGKWGLVIVLLLGLTISISPVQVGQAATRIVTNANDSGAGSLRQTIANAAAGDTIVFDPSLQGATITLTSAQISINKNLTLIGLGAGNLTISGNHKYRVFNIGSARVVNISGLTIAAGTVKNDRGGGIYNAGKLTLANSIVTGNQITGTLQRLLSWGGSGIYNAGTLTVTQTTISNNNDISISAGGGGLFNDGSVRLEDSTISGNQVHTTATFGQYGGGGLCNRGTATIVHSSVLNNTAAGYSSGGGGGIYNAGSLTLTDSTVRGNRSITITSSYVGGYGGGLLNWQNGTLTVVRSTIADNVADRDGGGVENVGILTVTQSLINGNVARGINLGKGQSLGVGGGIDNTDGQLTLSNTTISGNTAKRGGGLGNEDGAIRVTFSTISNNTAAVLGGGLFISGTLTETTVSLLNTIVATSSSGGECVNTSGQLTTAYTLIADASCAPALSGDPLLGPLQNNGGNTDTHALLPGSPAIDQGRCDNVLIDQRGYPRPIDLADYPNADLGCDLGAFEVQNP